MQLLLVCLWLVASALATGPSLEDTDERFNPPSFSMPVQFSMAAPLSTTPDEQPGQKPQDWSVSKTSQSVSHRRGHYRPPRLRRRKHPHYMMDSSRRRRPIPHELLHHHRRVYPRYPPFLEPYSHNYKLNHPMHHQVDPHHYRPGSQHQHHNSYEAFPPYTAPHNPTGQSEMVSSLSQTSTEVQYQPQSSVQQSDDPQVRQPQHQELSSIYDPQSQLQSHQSSLVQYPPYSARYPNDEQQNSNQNEGFPRYPSQYDSGVFMQHPLPPSHQEVSFDYPPLPSNYAVGEISHPPQHSYREPPIHEHVRYGGRRPSIRPYPHGGPRPEYYSTIPREVVDLKKEINQPSTESHRSIFHLLLPLLMVGISIPAIGYMYTHLGRRRSNDDFTWPWIATENLEAYMQMFERGLQCYQHDEKCS